MTLEEQYENETGVQWSEFDCKLCFDGDYIQWLENLVATRTAERDELKRQFEAGCYKEDSVCQIMSERDAAIKEAGEWARHAGKAEGGRDELIKILENIWNGTLPYEDESGVIRITLGHWVDIHVRRR